MRIFCFLACILTSIQLCCQVNKADSKANLVTPNTEKVNSASEDIRAYKSILNDKNLNEREKTDSLISCIQKLYQIDPWSAVYLTNSLYNYSIEKKYVLGEARSLFAFGTIQSFLGKFKDSDTSCIAAIELFEQIPDVNRKVKCLLKLMENASSIGDYERFDQYSSKVFLDVGKMNRQSKDAKVALTSIHQNIATSLSNRSQLDSAIYHYTMATEYAEQLEDDSYLSRCLLNFGSVYLQKDDYIKAFEYWLKCKQIAKENNDLKLQTMVAMNMAITYQNLGDYDASLMSFEEQLAYSNKSGDLHQRILALVNIASSYFGLGEFDKAMSQFILVEQLAKNIDIGTMKFTIYIGKGAIAMNRKEYSYAEKMFKLADEEAKKYGSIIRRSQLFLNWGALNFAQKKWSAALKYFKLTRELEIELGSYDYRSAASKYCHEIYKIMGKRDQALQMLELYTKERDTLVERDSRTKVIALDLQSNFELKRKEDSITHANELTIQLAQSKAKDESIKRKNSELKVKRNQQLMLFGGMGLLALFILFILNRFRVSAKQNKIIEKQKDKNLYLSQKILEQDQQLILGETAKTVAHELNSPLGAIKAGAEGMHYLMEELINNLLPASSKEDLDVASHLSRQQETGTFVGMKQKQEKAKNIQIKLSEKFGLESASSSEIASELSELHVFNPDEKIINFLVSCQDRQPIYKLAKCIGQIKMISETTILATNKSADVVSSVREALDFQTSQDFEDVRLDESISSVVTIVESNINEKGTFKHNIDSEVYLRSVNEFKIFQLWYNLIIFIVEEAEESMEIQVNASENESSTQVRFSINQAIQNKTLNEHHYKIIMDAKRDSNDLRMGIVKYLLSENNIELQSEISSDQTVFTIDFPSIHKSS
jgi:tetratricopeptide (TPR) repeat protein